VGLSAFVFFVVPWMLVAAWLFRSSGGFRMGVPATPWRALTDFPEPQRDQRTIVDADAVPKGAANDTADDKHQPFQAG